MSSRTLKKSDVTFLDFPLLDCRGWKLLAEEWVTAATVSQGEDIVRSEPLEQQSFYFFYMQLIPGYFFRTQSYLYRTVSCHRRVFAPF